MGNAVIYRPAYDAEVEYLQNSGGQEIDTGILQSSDISIELDFQFTDEGSEQQNILRGISPYVRLYRISPPYIHYDFNGVAAATDTRTDVYERHKIYICNGMSILDEVSVQFRTTEVQSDKYIFMWYDRGRASKIYSLKLWDNNVLVRDFIPVRIGSVGYMYDKVSKQLFANKGKGNFILGNDVSNAVIPQQRYVFYSPMYDAQVEYLASTGTQWIDTKAENCKTFKFRFKALNAAEDLKIFGNSVAYPKLANFTLYQSLFRGTSIPVESNTWYDVEIQELNPPTLKITKGVEVSTGTLPYSGNREPNTSYGTELPIFGIIASNSNGPFYTGSYFINRMNKYIQNETYFSYFQAFDENGVLIRDFIPVRKGQVGYMYDKVSKQLFTNKGTGSFILGSDTNDAVASQRSVGFERIYEEYEWLGTGSGNPHIKLQQDYNTDENAFIETTYKCQYINDNVDMFIGFGIFGSNVGIRIFNNISKTFIDVHRRVNGTTHTAKRISVGNGQIGVPRYLYASLTEYQVDDQGGPITLDQDFDGDIDSGVTIIYTNDHSNDVWYKETKLRANNITYDLIPCKLLQPIPAILDANGIARQAGECGMWDKINDVFYGNVANSGTFTVSND